MCQMTQSETIIMRQYIYGHLYGGDEQAGWPAHAYLS